MTCQSIRYLSFARAYFVEFGAANLVDVPDDQGLVQHGMVVNVTESGVLVDFICKGQPPRLVEYGKLFLTQYCGRVRYRADPSIKTEVLIRLSRDRPFTWHLADCLDVDAVSFSSRALLQVQFELDGTVVREIVHSSQIRSVPIGEVKQIVHKDWFETLSCSVPGAYASTLSNASPLWIMCCQKLQIADWVHVMRLHNGHVDYLRRKTEVPVITRYELEMYLDCMARRMVGCLARGLVWSGSFFKRPSVTVLPDCHSEAVPFACLSSLPIDLLAATFQCLESVDRVRLRRVTPRWNDVLSMEAVFNDVWVSSNYRYDCPFKWSVWDTAHGVVLALTRLVTKSTKWLIFTRTGDSRRPETNMQNIQTLLNLIADVARYFRLPCAGNLSIIISQYRWCPGVGISAETGNYVNSVQSGVDEIVRFCSSCKSVYGTLVWRDCTVEDGWYEEAIFPIRREAIQVSSPTLQADLWDMLDRNAPEVDTEKLTQWLFQDADTGEICSLLGKYQVPDPRITAQSTLYHGDELAHVETDELDVRRLTRLTLWMLSAETAKTTARGIKRRLNEVS